MPRIRKVAIIDDAASNEGFRSVPASWLIWEAQRAEVEVVSCNERPDVVLVHAVSPDLSLTLRRRAERAGARGVPIVVGGPGASTPASFESSADVMCVGEGARFVRGLFSRGLDYAADLPEAWVRGERRTVVPNLDFPWELPPVLYWDGRYRVFESRGCKHKCLFCQTGWSRKFVPNPDPARVLRQCRELDRRGLGYDLVTNDLGDSEVLPKLKGVMSGSARFDTLRRTRPGKLPRVIRIGVEGVSERLRRAIGKPIPHDGLVALVRRLMQARKTIRLFYVVGFPFEDDSDWAEMIEFVREISREDSGSIQFNMHALIPETAAPISILPLNDTYVEASKQLGDAMFDGDFYNKRVMIRHAARYSTRLDRARVAMSCSEADLRRGWWFEDNPNWRVAYLAPPWKMRRLAAVYARKMGQESTVPQGVIVTPHGGVP